MKILLILLYPMILLASGASTTPQVDLTPPQLNTASVTSSVTVALTSVKIVSASPARHGLILYNNSSNSVYLSTQCPANSATNLFAIVPTFASYSFPLFNYLGQVCGIRNAGTGNVVVTEFY